MRQYLPLLLLLSCLFLSGMGGSTFLLVRLHRRSSRVKYRTFTVTEPHLRSGGEGNSTLFRLTTALPTATALRQLSLLFGYDPLLRQRYRLPWVVVVIVALILSVAAAYAGTSLIGIYAWLATPVAWVFASRSYYKRCDNRLTQTLYKQFPDALATIVRSVRVGVPVSESIRTVAKEALEPTATEFGRVADQITIGVPLDEALRDLALRNQLPEYRFFATALSLQSQTGGGLTETLENLADTIRKRVAAKAKGNALAAEAKTSTYVLAALPIVMGGLIFIVNRSYILILFTDDSGRKLLFLAMGMLGAGFYAMRTIIRKSLS